MLFHRIELLPPDKLTTISEKALQKKAFIIPLVTPGSAAGQFLLSKEESAILSSYSKKTDIYFVAKETLEVFEEFTSRVVKETARRTGILPKNPAIIAFDNGGHVFLLQDVVVDDRVKFEKTMYGLIDALESDDVDDAMDRIIKNLSLSRLYREYGDNAKELLKFILGLFGVK